MLGKEKLHVLTGIKLILLKSGKLSVWQGFAAQNISGKELHGKALHLQVVLDGERLEVEISSFMPFCEASVCSICVTTKYKNSHFSLCYVYNKKHLMKYIHSICFYFIYLR